MNFYLHLYPGSTDVRDLSQFLLHIFLLSAFDITRTSSNFKRQTTGNFPTQIGVVVVAVVVVVDSK
jgi:hypothetical protein